MIPEFDPTYEGNRGGYLGIRPCGNADAWKNGVSLFNFPPPCHCAREAVIPIQEDPVEIIDGINRVFNTTLIPMSDESLLVFVNGVAQQQGVNYTVVDKRVTFSVASTPTVGSNVFFYYWIQT